jgi:tetratricopeptide (TPR) repeat protein
MQRQMGDTAAARAAYQQSLEIRQRLAAVDPANTQAQRDLFVSHYKMGMVQTALGNPDAARQAYQQALAIAEPLAQKDPLNKQAQDDVAAVREALANM